MTAVTDFDNYLEAHIREALATDARTNFLDPQLTITAGKVFIMGSVESEERRLAIEAVVREVTPEGVDVVNELYVEYYEVQTAAEERI